VGLTLEGTLILTRKKANKKLYGRSVTSTELLNGKMPPPEFAEPLYRMLNQKFGDIPFFKGSDTTLNTDSYERIAVVDLQSAEPATRSSTLRKVPPPKPAKNVRTCIALYDFQGEQPGDLSFKKGDTICISSQNGEWFEGSCHGSRGSFPANYVRVQAK
jgi:hypothetical protein